MVGTRLLVQLLHCRNKNKLGNSSTRKSTRISNSLKHHKKKPKVAQDTVKIKDDYNMKIKNELFEDTDSLNLCRVCLKEGMISIFGSSDSEIIEALQMFGGIEIFVEDNFPKHLCQPCYDLLQGAILFRATAQKSDKILKEPSKEVISDLEPQEMLNDDDFFESDFADEYEDRKETNFKPIKVLDKGQYCKRCDLRFDDLETYKDHMASEEHENKKTTCQYCQKEVKAIYLTRHIHVNHDPSTLFICDICGKEFTVKDRFKHHRMTHSNELPFKCSVCPYRGRFKEALKMHMRSHMKEKPYKCPHCPNRTFANKSNLSRHVMTHTKEKNFKCGSCGRDFYFKRELEQHFKVDHTGIKDHVCDICFKAFGYRKQMMKHQLKVHKRSKFKGGRLPLYLRKEFQEQPDTQEE